MKLDQSCKGKYRRRSWDTDHVVEIISVRGRYWVGFFEDNSATTGGTADCDDWEKVEPVKNPSDRIEEIIQANRGMSNTLSNSLAKITADERLLATIQFLDEQQAEKEGK